MMRVWLVALAAAACCGAAPPDQNYLVDVWNVDHGMPQGSVMHVAQTPDGYLWIATFWQGIARFDGLRFVTYTPVTTPELPDQEGWRLLVDSRGTLWIASLQGSLTSYREGRFALEFKRQWRLKAIVQETASHIVFATQDGRLVRGPAEPGRGGPWEMLQPPDTDVYSQFAADAEGAIWFTRTGRRVGRFQAGGFEALPVPAPGLRGRRVRALAADPGGRIWVGTDVEVGMWTGSRFETMTPTNGEPTLSVLRLAFAPDGGLWVEADGRLRKCRHRRWVAEAQGWTGEFGPTGDPLLMNGDAEGGLWFTHVGDGMIHVEPNGTLHRLTVDSGLANNLTRCWLQDREGNIWTGSERGGLMRIRKRDFHVLDKAHGLTDASITSVAEDTRGNLWCGSLNGTVYRWRDGRSEEFTLPMQGGRTRCATVFPSGDRLWVGTSGNGVLAGERDEFKHVIEAAQIGTVARAILADKTGRLWVGNERALYCWDGQTLHTLETDALALAEGPDEVVWAGNSAGELCRIRSQNPPGAPAASPGAKQGPSFEVARYRPGDGQPACRIWALLAEADGTVWVATDGAGLLRFRHNQFVRFTTSDGLPSDTIFQVLDDLQGRLWLGIRSGMACADKAAFEQTVAGDESRIPFRVYGRYDGLHTLELCSGYQPACWRGKDGRLWFATAHGVVFVQPADLRVNPLPPPVVLEQVRVDGKALELSAASQPYSNRALGLGSQKAAPTRLSPGRHFLEFQFTALSFTAPDKVRFRWRLEGLETDWVHGGAEVRRAVYNPVLPGHYKFRVQACNNDGVWNETGAELALSIPQFFWKTPWFLTLCGLCSAAALAGWVRHVTHQRLQRRLERLEQQRSIERERTRIAQDLHDDLGASLTEISMLAASSGAASSPAGNGDALAEIARRSDQLVRTMDEIVWAVNPRHDSVVSLAEYLSAFARDFLASAGIRPRLDVQRDLPPLPLNPEQRHEVFHAVKEAVRNAARHSQAAEVWLRFRVEAQTLTVRVEDDGRGFDPAAVNAGNGLRNMRERLARLGGTCRIQTGVQKGTAVEMSLPLK
ncbi:MAG TPA: two-component regulator propeller domain-containing protein [Verrucomicrobiota bacterium]|nr:two-component regulator propeller domain-containing protein [Verrucomicrobiota bacterium]